MSQEQRSALDELLRNGPLDIGGDPEEQRKVFRRMLTARPLPPDVITTPAALHEVPTLKIEIDGVDAEDVLLWFHGGFYVLGSPATSAGLASNVARRTGTRVISVDYRLAPENPYPAALEDVLAAYRALLQTGVDPSRIAFVGESAGAGLATATLASLDSEADLTGLPPLLIQVGTHEILLDDATRLAARAAADDVPVTLEVTPGVPHLFQAFAAILDEGEAALQRVEAFLRTHLAVQVPA